jgi:hypothetical protein
MWYMAGRFISLMVVCGIALHYIWAILVLVNTDALNSTPLASLHNFFDHFGVEARQLALILVLSSISSSVAMWFDRAKLAPLLLLPQQILLIIAATGCFSAAWLGEYADGVPRAHAHILSDQLPMILIAAFYSIAIIFYALRADNARSP